MITSYQKSLLDDLQHPASYGTPLAGWKVQTQFFGAANPRPGSLTPDLANTFVEQSYFLLKTARVVTVYRGFESQGIQAPYGTNHPSFLQGLITARKPGRPDGMWWTPARPALAIENMGLSSMQRYGPRRGGAILKEWNRLDFFVEGQIAPNEFIYVGRACAQQEKAAFGAARYGGGDIQFRVLNLPTRMHVYRSL